MAPNIISLKNSNKDNNCLIILILAVMITSVFVCAIRLKDAEISINMLIRRIDNLDKPDITKNQTCLYTPDMVHDLLNRWPLYDRISENDIRLWAEDLAHKQIHLCYIGKPECKKKSKSVKDL